MFTALNVTGDAIAAGVLPLDLPDGTGSLRVTLVSDPLAIPAETGRIEPELLVVPEECKGQVGTWTPMVYSAGPDPVRVVSVSELSETRTGPGPAREPVVSKYLPGVAGAVKGTIIHEVLRGRDAATVLKEYGEFSEEHVRQCEEIRSAFFSTDLMKRVKRSYCEVPFVVTVEGKLVAGKIDRLCEMEDGSWVVIDYKSEDFTLRSVLVKKYALSLSTYIKATGQVVRKPVEGFLYLTESGEYSKDEK